jgi:hypothetical protein
VHGRAHLLLARVLRKHGLNKDDDETLRWDEETISKRPSKTYRESLSQHFFALPPALPSHIEEFHIALSEMRSMVGVKDEDASAWRDGRLAGCEQRAMLFA